MKRKRKIRNLLLSSKTSTKTLSVKIIDGVEHHFYEKELIKCGTYYMGDDPVEITSRDLKSFVREFNRYIKAGNKVNVPATHEGAWDPTKNHGYVVKMWVKGNVHSAPINGFLNHLAIVYVFGIIEFFF